MTAPTNTPTPFGFPTFTQPTARPIVPGQGLSGGQVPDLYIKAVEVTQGMQDLKNSMPIVANRRAYVRVHVCSEGQDWADVNGVLFAESHGAIIPPPTKEWWEPLWPVNGPIVARADCGDRLDLDDSLLFEVPMNWLNPDILHENDLNIRAFIYSGDPKSPEEKEPSAANNFKDAKVTLVPVRDVDIVLVPLHMHIGFDEDNPTLIFDHSPANTTDILHITASLHRLHPIARLNVWKIEDPLEPFGHEDGSEWDFSEDGNSTEALYALQWLYSETDEGGEGKWLAGMVHPDLSGAKFDGQSDILTPEGGKAIWLKMDSGVGEVAKWWHKGGDILGHELAHNADLHHVGCKDADDDDIPDESAGGPLDQTHPTDFPDCSIAPVDPEGFYGFDVYWLRFPSFVDGPTVISNDPKEEEALHRAFPLLSYVNPGWPDAYHYCLLLNYYATSSGCSPSAIGVPGEPPDSGGSGGGAPAADCKPEQIGPKGTFGPLAPDFCLNNDNGDPVEVRPGNPSSEWIALSGSIDLNSHEAAFDLVLRKPNPTPREIAQAEARHQAVRESRRTSPYWLTLEDASDRVLSAATLIDTSSGHGTHDSMGFFQMREWVPGTEWLRIRYQGQVIAERRVSPNAPSVRVIAPNGGEDLSDVDALTVTWEGHDPENDALLFNVYYSADDGSTWKPLALGMSGSSLEVPIADLAGSDRARVRVLASDGVNTATDTSDGVFRTPNTPPFVVLHSPGPGGRVGQGMPVGLSGGATDLEDGVLGGDSLRWSSSLDGKLGEGRELLVEDLRIGRHRIALTAIDSSGAVTEAAVELEVTAEGARRTHSRSEARAVARAFGFEVDDRSLGTWEIVALALAAGAGGAALIFGGKWLVTRVAHPAGK